MGVAAAHMCLGIDNRLAENDKPIVWDSLLEESELTDCDRALGVDRVASTTRDS